MLYRYIDLDHRNVTPAYARFGKICECAYPRATVRKWYILETPVIIKNENFTNGIRRHTYKSKYQNAKRIFLRLDQEK